MTTFSELGLCAPLVTALDGQGITEPFAIQELALPDALAGRDVCGKAKTGSGKTLAFGLPMLQRLERDAEPRLPRALVLCPTRELASQIDEALRPLAEAVELRIDAFYGGTPIDRQIKVLNRGVDAVVATPGRLIDLLEQRALSLDAMRFVVVDEADRMADMGFLPQVEWILRRLGDGPRQTMLFSATLDAAVDGLRQRYLTDEVIHEVESSQPTVSDMTHRFLQVHEMDRVRVVASIAAGVERTIVFCNTKRAADRLTDRLEDEGVRVAVIHGDRRQEAREKALEQFTQGKLPVLVATDVAARGIHVDDVDVVIHFDPPDDPKNYLHRSGRTARAGRSGVVVTFVLWNQELEIKRLQKRLRLDQPLIEVFSNDPRLADLADDTAWLPDTP